MREAQIKHSTPEPADLHRRFEDIAEDQREDAVSFFFDLKLMLPAGLPALDIHRARLNVERRLHRVMRKKDRMVWAADGFFLLLATTDPARAGAAAERIHQDICTALGDGDTKPETFRRPAAPAYTALSRVTGAKGKHHGSAEME
jgi:hypothetical protein